jgi:hypothetical protein
MDIASHIITHTRFLQWGVIAAAISLLPFTSFVLSPSYYAPEPLPSPEQSAPDLPEKYDAKYHETRCYQVLTVRNYHEDQTQWESPCACTANFAVMAEVEYDALLERYNSTVSESGAEHLLYGFYPTFRLSKPAEASRVQLKFKFQKLIREQCWMPAGLDRFWTNTDGKPSPVLHEPMLPPASIVIVETLPSLSM